MLFTELVKPEATESVMLRGGSTFATAMFVGRYVMKDIIEFAKEVRTVYLEFRKDL